MNELRTTFFIITTQGHRYFEFDGSIEQQIAILDLINGREPLEWFDGTCHRMMYRYDDAMKKTVDDFANRFGGKHNIEPFELRKFMKTHLKDNEPFYMFRMDGYLRHVNQIQFARAVYQLEAIKEGKNTDEIWNKVKVDLEPLLNDYYIRSLGIDDYSAGENTDDRVCRFCGKTKATGATFDHKSHAISEALGNKKLVCNEECDDCNKRLASIEDSLSVAYLEIRRSLCGIKGKNGVNSVAGQNFVKDAKTHQIVIKEKPDIEDKSDKIRIRLEGKEVFTFQNLYKALTKIVIDLVDTEEVVHFRNTIDWINGKLVATEFPPIKQMYCDTIFAQPIIEIFIRRNKNDISMGPYCFANLFVCDLAFQFVIPFVDVDKGKMKTANHIKPFERKMGATLAIYNWKSEWLDGGDTTERTAFTEIEYDKSNICPSTSKLSVSQNLHIMPPKWRKDTIEFPPFNPAIIKFSKVLQCEVSNINRGIHLDEEWLHDTSNNMICNLIVDKQTKKVLVDIRMKICNTDNTEHLLNTRVAKEFSLDNLDDILAIIADDIIEMSGEFVSFITEQSLIELEPLFRKIHPMFNIMKADARLISNNYHCILATWKG